MANLSDVERRRGIETSWQLATLNEMGCNYGQGYVAGLTVGTGPSGGRVGLSVHAHEEHEDDGCDDECQHRQHDKTPRDRDSVMTPGSTVLAWVAWC
jgi:EAL domain-containing protein (putative c-di-GMP-specific phosphodiesterase class I)